MKASVEVASTVFLVIASGLAQSLLNKTDFEIDYETAVELANLPLNCYNKQFPYKPQAVLNSPDDLLLPKQYHAIFYGCFDWHSSVHGHWLLATLLQRFPNTELAQRIIKVLDEQFVPESVEKELTFLKSQAEFERTYGWSWFLKLHQQLMELGQLDAVHAWSATLQPMADYFVEAYKIYLPKLIYPIRVGEHSNTAFGLIFPLDYAQYIDDNELIDAIRNRSRSFYGSDVDCPITWEPNGNDFLSPCLQEADLLGQLKPQNFTQVFASFLPQFMNDSFVLEPGHVSDAADGKLVHLHGLNFSRAWNLYSLISQLGSSKSMDLLHRLFQIADDHLSESIGEVTGGHYVGTHWLATFVTYALQKREEAIAVLRNVQN